MARFTVYRVRRAATTPSTVGTILLGLGMGVAAGFVLGELAGPATSLAIRPRATPTPQYRSLAALVAEAQSALDGDLLLRDARLQVLAAGRDRIELHGWVGDRRGRTRAARLVSDAIRAGTIINCIRVRGEDDSAAGDEVGADELLA